MDALRPTLALTVRSMREDARIVRVHLVRLLFVAFILWLLWIAHEQSRWLGAPGLSFFANVCYLNLVVITIAGFGYFSTAVAEEKEEQTIGLLLMADVGPTAILVGKAIPRLLGAGLVLLAQFPFTLLAITLGGVLRNQIVAAYVTMASYLILAAGVGLFFSVLCRTSLAAARNSVILLGTFLLLPALIDSAFGIIGDPFTEASPFTQIGRICSTGFAGPPLGWPAATNLIVGAGLFVLARVIFLKFAQDDSTGGPTRSLLDRIGRRARGSRGSSGLRPRRSWGNAVAWKDFFFIAGGRRMMALKFILYPMAVIGLIFVMAFAGSWGPRNWFKFDEAVGGTFMVTMTFVFVLEAALIASRLFNEEIRWHTLATIAMLPQDIFFTTVSKVLGCLPALLPSLAYFILGAMIYPRGMAEFIRDTFDEPGFWWFASQVILFIHLTAFYSVFLRWGSLPLSFGTIFLINACCISAFEVMLRGGGGGREDGLFVFLTMLTMGAIAVIDIAIVVRLRTVVSR